MLEIPDIETPIILTQKEYPDLPFNEVEITNPREFKEKIFLYHKLMVEAYYNGEFISEPNNIRRNVNEQFNKNKLSK